MIQQPAFTAADLKAAYELRYHFGWYAHRRQPLFQAKTVREVIPASLTRVAQQRDYHLLEWELEPAALRALISLRPDQSPAEVTRAVKGNLTSDLRKPLGNDQKWSRGWFVRSNGHVTDDVVRAYVRGQFAHHDAVPGDLEHWTALCRWHDPADVAELRKSNHAVFEYNVHFVFAVRRRCEFLEPQVADQLLTFWRNLCGDQSWRLWDAEVVWNHAHLFVGLCPSDTPLAVALSLLNESEAFLTRGHAAAIALEGLDTLWQPGFYAGTVGAATTAQIRAFLDKQAGAF